MLKVLVYDCTVLVPVVCLFVVNSVIGVEEELVFAILRLQVIPSAEALAAVEEAIRTSTLSIVTECEPLSKQVPAVVMS